MSDIGLTRARSMGPIAAAVRRAGGSVSRMFEHAELPLSLVDQPDLLIPLRDQLRLLEFATRETGDDALAARLSLEGGVEHLGTFGRHVCEASTLRIAIGRCNDFMGSLLQSATHLRLLEHGCIARWTYSITDDAQAGRQKNEYLALGYMLDLLRRYFGVDAGAIRAEIPGARGAAHTTIQDVLGCEIARGDVAALVFPAQWLDARNRTRFLTADFLPREDGVLPSPSDFVAHVERMVLLGILDHRPRQDWLCRRLRISRRSLQRALAARHTSFREVVARVLLQHAAHLLASSRTSITEIALELGYADPAHFTRAFVRAFGESPQAWRRANGGGVATPSLRGGR